MKEIGEKLINGIRRIKKRLLDKNKEFGNRIGGKFEKINDVKIGEKILRGKKNGLVMRFGISEEDKNDSIKVRIDGSLILKDNINGKFEKDIKIRRRVYKD